MVKHRFEDAGTACGRRMAIKEAEKVFVSY